MFLINLTYLLALGDEKLLHLQNPDDLAICIKCVYNVHPKCIQIGQLIHHLSWFRPETSYNVVDFFQNYVDVLERFWYTFH